MTRWARTFVWVGGALFVVALALTTGTYVWRFGGTRPYAGWPPVAFDALLFTAFACHHSVFAREGVKRALASIVPEELLRSTYVHVASLLLIVVCLGWQPIGGTVYMSTGARFVAHILVQLAGLWFIAASVRAIDALELAGIRESSNTGLQVGGPYRLVRHPLYLGWVLAVFGAPHMTGDRLTFAIVSSMYLVVAVPWEEQSLERAFGESYRHYKQRVRWRMLPFVY